MSVSKVGSLAVILLVLASCATSQPYGPADGPGEPGYSQQMLEPGRYRISYRGDDPEKVRDLALYRAAELTLANNLDWFQVVSSAGGVEGGPSGGPRVSVGGGVGSIGSRTSGGVGIGIGLPVGGGGRSAVEIIEIIMGSGAKPADPAAYDARSIANSLKPPAGK